MDWLSVLSIVTAALTMATAAAEAASAIYIVSRKSTMSNFGNNFEKYLPIFKIFNTLKEK